MVKNSTPVEKAARMLDLVPYICAHQGIATQDLADQFGISLTELLVDLKALWMCGDNRFDLIELEFESGFVTIRNADTLNLVRTLSQREIVAILIGLNLIAKALPEERVDLRESLEQLTKKLGKGTERVIDATPATNATITQTILSAIAKGSSLEIGYFSPAQDARSQRTITPTAYSQEGSYAFLVAFCHVANAQRTFRVDRIESASLSQLPRVVSDSSNLRQPRFDTKISISRNIRAARESLGLYVVGGSNDVVVSSYSQSWLARTVISSAGAMQVTGPAEIRNALADLARKSLALYR